MLLNKKRNISNDIAIHQKINTEHRITLVDNNKLKPHNGHSIFEYNTETNTLGFADVQVPSVVNFLTWKSEINNRFLVEKQNCLYVSGLNYDSAIKHLNRQYGLKLTNDNIIINRNISQGGTHVVVSTKKVKKS